ncbi:MAG: hypothetical protein KDB66_09105 [Solirubrobacterales bacterium]|nr:hypothetical protein [Solirubrobacterales bacterium]MCB8914414.1 hypothetical protein [Thermoleophilales bacterium]
MKKLVLATMTTLLAMMFVTAGAASAAVPSDRDPIPPPTDYWQDKGFILMAHQGGEWDFPPNTLFAYKSAMNLGADMIDMDAYVTADGHIVLSHDLDARKNSDLTDDMFGGKHDITDLTLAQLKTLDFAYKWSPHDGSSTTPWRGVATGDVPPPTGFAPNDFKIPTFDEVLDAFPDTPINIELKQVGALSQEDIDNTAATMAGILAAHPGHDENVIINSFGQEMLDAMHLARPEHKSYSGSQDASLAYINGQPITPTPVAIEPPDYFKLSGNWLRTVPILKPWTDHDGYQLYVWGSDHDLAQDTDPFYAKLIEEGADSYNTPSPITLAAYLCNNGIASPDGSPRCPAQVCPEGQTGIAPDNCVDIPVCPEGTEGTPPDCTPIVTPEPFAKLRKITLSPKKATVKAGKKKVLQLAVSVGAGKPISVTVNLKSSNGKVKVQRKVKLTVGSGKTVKKITVNLTRKARGKAKITASSGKFRAASNIKVKPAKKERR